MGHGAWGMGYCQSKILPSSYNSQNLFAVYELPEIRSIIDRTAIVDTIVGFANAFDAKDWQKVR